MGDNVRWESSGKNGKKRRRCKECLKIKAQRQAKNTIPVVEPPKPYRPQDETLRTAIRDFEEARKYVAPNCQGKPGPWMDWEEPPTRAEAQALCHGCPLVKACRNYATAAQEWHGVWGGDVVHEGTWL